MMEEQTVFLSLLTKKKELVFKLLRMANDATFAEEDVAANVDRYVAFVEARGEIINELEKLSGELAKLAEPPGVSREAGLLNREIKEMAEQIIRVEIDLRKKAKNIMTNLQQELAKMNKHKKINDAYDAASPYGGR